MKKITLALLALVVSTGLSAEIVKLNGLYYSLGSTTAQVVADQSAGKTFYPTYTTVTIPASVTYNNYTYPVTSIGTSAFEACTELQSVTLPTSVTAINTDAFYGCSKLGSVNLEEGLKTIGTRAFWGCNLKSITVPSSVTSVGNAAFKGNPTTSVTWLPKNCTIGSDTDAPFYSTSSKITSFTFGDSVQTVPAYLCKYMSKLDTVVLPPSVSSLGPAAFMYCTSLKSINLPVTQKTLPANFFEGCTALDSIALPATLTTIRTDAFYGCSNLSKVHLHEGLTTLETRAFWGCKLTDITIPSTVTSLGNAAFKGNPATSITWLPATCTVGADTDAPFYSTSSQVTSFTFGENVQVVPAYLCHNMTKLDTVVLPETVTSIGTCAFKGCSALKGIRLHEGITSVGQKAFMYCTSLKELEFPKGVTSLATSVLEGCTALETVVIPSTVTSINTDALYGCSHLLELHNYAFTPQTIAERTVNNVNKSTCILYVPMDYIDLYQSKAVWCDFLHIIGVATDLQFEEQTLSVSYLKPDSTLHYMEAQTWQVPHAPRIEGFTFLKWQVLAGDLADGVVLQAVYEAKMPTETPMVVNPANPAQKLVRQGNVYILRDDKTYTLTGARYQ